MLAQWVMVAVVVVAIVALIVVLAVVVVMKGVSGGGKSSHDIDGDSDVLCGLGGDKDG